MPVVKLPTLHADQSRAYLLQGRHKAIRCGRRWGKSTLASVIACDGAIKREAIGYFTPEYKFQSEIYNEIADILSPVIASKSKTEGVIRTVTGGRIDFWSLENELAGRSRKYHKVIIDEAAYTKNNMMAIWQRAIEPTLLDYTGSALVVSNTNGVDPENFFWRICNQPEHGFVEFHAPSINNPDIPERKIGESEIDYQARRSAEFEKIRSERHPLVYAQEYLAEFVSWAGVAFFEEEKLLVDWAPVDYPRFCDSVYAVIDSATKDGKEHDGTAVSYWARSQRVGHPLVCLDWDIISIKGSLLEAWIPRVFARLEELARECRARYGSRGAFIEDRDSGQILLQQMMGRNMPVAALPSILTAAGKDGRARNASSAVYRGEVKWSRYAHEKTLTFHEQTKNHMISQVHGFRMGDKDAYKRSDDLLDTFTYAVAISLGDAEGIA